MRIYKTLTPCEFILKSEQIVMNQSSVYSFHPENEKENELVTKFIESILIKKLE